MQKKSKRIFIAIPLVLAFFIYFRIYKIDSFEITILDSDTKQPVSEAVLLAYWQLHMGSPAGTVRTGILEVIEARSDKNGRVGYSGRWKIVPWHSGWISESLNPTIVIHRLGYTDREINNVVKVRSVTGGKIYRNLKLQKEKGSKQPIYAGNYSFWNNSILELAKDKPGTQVNWAKSNLSNAVSTIESKYKSRCHWVDAPFSFLAEQESRVRFYNEKGNALARRIKKRLKSQPSCPDYNQYRAKYL